MYFLKFVGYIEYILRFTFFIYIYCFFYLAYTVVYKSLNYFSQYLSGGTDFLCFPETMRTYKFGSEINEGKIVFLPPLAIRRRTLKNLHMKTLVAVLTSTGSSR